MKPKSNRKPADLFAGWPGTFELFNEIRKFLESLGPVTIETTRMQVSFGVIRKFAWVWLPQMYIKKQPVNSLTLTFAVDYPIEHPQIKQKVEPRPGRWTHHVVIKKNTDFNDTVRQWLREARALSERPKKTAR